MLRTLAPLVIFGALATCLVLPALSQEGPPTTLGPLTTRQVAPDTLEVHLQATTLRALGGIPEVPIPTSRLRFVGPVKLGALLETCLLGSLYVVDLNGNGRLDQLPVHHRDQALRIDQMAVDPLGDSLDGPQRPFRGDGELRRSMLDPDAPEFTVLFYQPDPPTMGLDLQWRGYRPSAERCPNPSLHLIVFEPCGDVMGPDDLPDDPSFRLELDGSPAQHVTFTWEPWIFERIGKSPQWLRSRQVFLPLPASPGAAEFSFRVVTSSQTRQVGMVAQVNYARQPGERLRGPAQVVLLRDAPSQP